MNKRKSKIIISVIMAILSLVIIFPYTLMLATALKSPLELQYNPVGLVPSNLEWGNFVEAFSRGNWKLYYFNTIEIVIITVAVSLLINSIAGYSFARIKFKGRDTLFIISLVGLMVPPQVTMIPLYIMMKNFPLLGGNNIFGHGGIGAINTKTGLIMPYIAGSFGVFLFRQFYMNFPKALDDAARIDGLGRVGTFFRIYAPLSKPVFATLAVLKATGTWNEYTWPLLMTVNDKSKTVQLALAMFKEEFGVEWHLLMAATAVSILPLVLLFVFAQKYFIKGIVTSGIKG